MKFIIAIVFVALCSCANQEALADKEWPVRQANAWAASLGEASPHSVCPDLTDSGNQAWCSARVGDRVYRVHCYYKDACYQVTD